MPALWSSRSHAGSFHRRPIGSLTGPEGDAVVRIANKLTEAHDETAMDFDPATRKLIEAVLPHVGLRLAEDVDPLQFGGGVN